MAGFGTPQRGTATRFVTKQDAQKEPFTPNVSNVNFDSPPGPQAYSGLRTGPDVDVQYEANQTPPVDGSNRLLRNLSPFMIQVEPPLAYAAQGDTSKKNLASILERGHGAAPSAFQAARNAIVDASTLSGSLTAGATSVEQFVAMGALNRPYGPDAVQARDLKGKGSNRIGSPAIADLYTAVDITMQLRSLVSTPPLVLLINPQSLSLSYAKVQQYTDRTRNGFVFQAWGEEQPKLSVEARCGAFISGAKGVQFASRRDSASWQNFQTAFQFYKHNGYIYDTVGKSNAHHFVGALSIHYDGWVYYGNMESFNYALEESQQNGGVTFSMEFTVTAMVDTSKTSSVVTPMRAPTPSLSDPRFATGVRPTPRRGDLSVGGPNGSLQFGGGNLQPFPRGSRSSSGTFGSEVGPGLVLSSPSNRGFVVPPTVSEAPTTNSPVSPAKVRPFGL